MKRILIVALVIAAAGCATAFYGSAKVKNGAEGCKTECDARGMDVAGMVVMGEYSDGCICQVRGAANKAALNGGPAAAGAVDGVMMQKQREAEAASHH
jgi:hypothetical protein